MLHRSLYALLFLAFLLSLSVLLEGCTDKCEVTNEYVYYEPVYTTVAAIREGIKLTGPQPIEAVGKIYYKDHYLFLSDPGKGVHIIDNHDPANPQSKFFLTIPGTYDLAIKGNILYADSYVDLVAFNIENINNIVEVSRLEGVFQNYRVMGFYTDINCCVITDWAEKKSISVVESECASGIQPWGGIYFERGIALNSDMAATFNKAAAIAPGTGSGPGVGGSLARFTINKDHLYLLDGSDVQAIDVTTEANPVAKSRITISWDMETIFPHEDNLFIGSMSGMHILDISSPESPVKISTYEHVRVCDPVVVQDNLAYVTLRSGSECQGFTNQLEVINIENLTSPKLLKIYPMTNPHGLGIDGEMLFVCDGAAGLKVYNASDKMTIDQNLLAHYDNIQATDVIPFNNILMMIGTGGIYQYDYSNPADIKFLSLIPIENGG